MRARDQNQSQHTPNAKQHKQLAAPVQHSAGTQDKRHSSHLLKATCGYLP